MKEVNKRSVILFLDNYVGYETFKILEADKDVKILQVVTHPKEVALYYNEIRELCYVSSIPVSEISEVRERYDEIIAPLNVDYLLSLYFDYILDDRFLNLPDIDAINLHPGYLPYNKGFYYYAWTLLDGTPAGVSLHQMVADVDKGNVISQLPIRIDNNDTGESIYKKHEEASINLFDITWPSIKKQNYKHYRQLHTGTHNSIKKSQNKLTINAYEEYKAIDLINQLRVFSFPDKKEGCLIKLGEKEYKINLELIEISGNEPINMPGGYQVTESTSN